MDCEKTIFVYADFLPFNNEFVGTLYVSQTRGKEFCSFEYADSWLRNQYMTIDPDLQMYRGRQYVPDNQDYFGTFADSSPDRWGQKLMRRREELRAKTEHQTPRRLLNSDYLLGVYDESRMGALRFKLDPNGPFLSDDRTYATPPWISLRELEQAAVAFDSDEDADGRWLKQLLAPGSSLGGARPKASVLAPDGSLWIAKFPSRNDDVDVGAWEMVVHDLAVLCGLNVSEAKSERFSKLGTTFLTKRFDREGTQRIHFASAMTMLKKKDGADATDGSSYLEIASFLKANGANVKADLKELWKRIVFGMAVSNTDDHFRNHGFLLDSEGWVLSPLYDVNPDMYGEYLSLNVDSYRSDISFDLALETAAIYGISKTEASKTVVEVRTLVGENWQQVAKKHGISRNEIQRMKPAFRLCNE